MKRLTYREFGKIYTEAVAEIIPHWTSQMQEEIARHNYGWREESFDFKKYLDASLIRYYKTYVSLVDFGKTDEICDIGGMWGAWPLTIKKIGYNVTMTETLKYYSKAFDNLFDYLRSKKIRVIDYDPFIPASNFGESFGFLSALAILEHYPHSLKDCMQNIISITAPGGLIYVETPNIAYLPKRFLFLKGTTPLVPLSEIYKSETPFTGHHHEMTINELRELADLCNLKIVQEDFYNYSWLTTLGLKTSLRHPFCSFCFLFFQNTREVLKILYQRKD